MDLVHLGHVFMGPQPCSRLVFGRPQPASDLSLATLWVHFSINLHAKCHSWLLIKTLKKHTAEFAQNPAVCFLQPPGALPNASHCIRLLEWVLMH